MQNHTVIERINNLCEARSWSYYRLAKESGIAYSTLFTMMNKAKDPSISTLQKICNGFSITMSQFFDDDDLCSKITISDKVHIQKWMKLTSENQYALDAYANFLLEKQIEDS